MRRALALGALLLAGCAPQRAPMWISFLDLVPIAPADGYYEVWVRTADRDLSAGRFRVAETYKLETLDADPDVKPAFVAPVAKERVKGVFVTQEPPGTPDDRPGAQVFLYGEAAPVGEFRLRAPVSGLETPAGWKRVAWGALTTIEPEAVDPKTAKPGPLRPGRIPSATVRFE